MRYDTKSYRNAHGISLDLPVKYRNVWFARLPEIRLMIIDGMTFKSMADHYEVKFSSFAMAMKYHFISATDILREHRECQAEGAA